MRYLFPLLFLVALVGCTRTGTATFTITRDSELSFTVENGATQYPITLTSGQLVIVDVNLIDESAPVPTKMLTAPQIYDFVASDTFFIDSVELRPKGFEQIHIFMQDATDGPLAGSTLILTSDVTLSNAQTETFTVELSLPRSSQEMLAAVSIRANKELPLEVSFDPTILLGKIDFDALSAQGTTTLSPDSTDPLVIDALITITDSLLRSFNFEGPIGGDITG